MSQQVAPASLELEISSCLSLYVADTIDVCHHPQFKDIFIFLNKDF